ncbi:MAG: carbamoyltransferase [Candidatus Latescibacteria bacterium]|nr:carbamoyltransferase [Candidatus Latescibacterota bacterium]
MNILGISCYYHDSAATLIQDGEIVAAAQEERFTRKKHDSNFPSEAIAFCMEEAGITPAELDYVAFYDKPLIKFERILQTYLAYAPLGIRSYLMAVPLWLKEKLWIPDSIRKDLDGYDSKLLFTEHHESHAASAFFPSPYQEAAFLTVDGVGEWATTTYGVGKGNHIEIMGEMEFPHSLGLLYSAFTYYTGFKVNSGEYKVMGLAPYGEPKYVDLIMNELIDLKEDGSFKMNMKYFEYCKGLTMTNDAFADLFGAPAKTMDSEVTQREMDITRSLQDVTEEIMLRMANHVHKETGQKYLVMAGGVALNCVGNGRVLREGPFDDIWIQPAAGDAGGALGAAMFTWHQYLGNERQADGKRDFQKGSFLGPEYSDDQIESYLTENSIPYRKAAPGELASDVAELIATENVIGWFQGKMEFGPRALGGRSIIGDARSAEMQATMNLKIKFRESFRPFAPSILREKVSEYFEMDSDSPYMLLVAPVKEDKRIPMTEEQDKLFGIEKLNVPRSVIPAVTHVDYSARVQTVDRETNPLYYDLISEVEKRTGVPIVINTSFNLRGEPIVCRLEEAYTCLMRTHMDYLVLGNYIIDKKEQTELQDDIDWKKEFELD